MKQLVTAIALTIAIPAALKANPNHAGHGTPPASAKPAPKAQAHPGGCHMMNGKMMEMKGGKPMPCSQQKAATGANNPHAGHNMNH